MAANTHRQAVELIVEAAVAEGVTELDMILERTDGADIRIVHEILTEKLRLRTEEPASIVTDAAASARRASANLPLILPAEDPLKSQWWFDLDTVVDLSLRVSRMVRRQRAAFLGCPTVGYHYSQEYGLPTTVFDADQDVIDVLDLGSDAQGVRYDVADALPKGVSLQYKVVLVDPPWYESPTRRFLNRARELISPPGIVLCVLPPRLTRPGIAEERNKLIRDLLSHNFGVMALESKAVRYRVPPFEAFAFEDLQGFSGRSWRHGDLLVLKQATFIVGGIDKTKKSPRFQEF